MSDQAPERFEGRNSVDPTLALPKDMQKLDVHLTPGGFHSEFVGDDVAGGALCHYGTAWFIFGARKGLTRLTMRRV